MSSTYIFLFFFNDTATTEIYTLSLHDALPIFEQVAEEHHAEGREAQGQDHEVAQARLGGGKAAQNDGERSGDERSEEHTSELQSRQYLVCRLLLEKKKKYNEERI